MPRGGGRGPKKNYKGRSRHFTDEETLRENLEKEKREKQWRKQKGEDEEEEEEEEKDKGKATATATGAIAEEDSESESESSSDDEDKHKGVSHLIAIENPNRVLKKNKKLSELDSEVVTGPKLTRREREELEKQQAKERYAKLHAEGKTDEARSDLARLQLIRKQREDAAKKREEERLAKEKADKKDS